MSQLALLHPPKVLASLHALSCKGPKDCSCRPIYVVHKEPSGGGAKWDNQGAEVAAKSNRLESRAARSGELPLIGRASARDTGGRP